MSHTRWSDGRSVYITSFWGWDPRTWGAVGFTDAGRCQSILQRTTNPFVMVASVTKNAPTAERAIRGRITGFFLVSHIEGDRDEFTDPCHHPTSPQSWRYSLKALRAFDFLPQGRLTLADLGPEVAAAARSVARYGRKLEPAQIRRLEALPFEEVPVYGVPTRRCVRPSEHSELFDE